MGEEDIREKINLLAVDSSNIESQIENLVIAMIDLDETRFEKVLSRNIIKQGFEKQL
ncbi:MAG: hypothetical protein HC896_13440 [Bacteroidales bacterium]|nr:hypothetical protein [Bacteroidales bacterium]